MKLKIPFTNSSLTFGSPQESVECQKCGVPTPHKCIKMGDPSKWRCETCGTIYVSINAKCSECPNSILGLLEDRDTWIKFECGACSSVTYFYIIDCVSCRKSTLHEDSGPAWKCVNCGRLYKMRSEHLAEIFQDISHRIQLDVLNDALNRATGEADSGLSGKTQSETDLP